MPHPGFSFLLENITSRGNAASQGFCTIWGDTGGPLEGENSWPNNSRAVELLCELGLSGLGCLSFKGRPFANRQTSPQIPGFTEIHSSPRQFAQL